MSSDTSEQVETDDVETPGVTQSGSTFAERAAARLASVKAVKADDTEDKAVHSSATKSRRTRKA